MIKSIERIGETNRATNGMLMKIIEYRSNTDIDIQFEDGKVVKNKTYNNFKKGYIKYPIKSFSNMCKIHNTNYVHALNYRKQHPEMSDIDIIKIVSEIDNNKIVTRIGEVNRAKNGLLMKIIEYRRCDDIDIKFEDGQIVKNKQYEAFKLGQIKHPCINAQTTDKTGETVLQNCGQYATVISYRNVDDIDIKFEDDTILKNKSYGAFKKGRYRNPRYHSIVLKICEKYGITFNDFYKEKCKNIKLTDNEIIEKLLSDTDTITYVKMQCKLLGLRYTAVKAYIDRNKDKTYTEIIKHYLELKDNYEHNELLEYCDRYNLSYGAVSTYKKRNPELTDEQVIEHYRTKSDSFRYRCEQLGINYHSACTHRRSHPELTDEQVLIHFRTDCYINMLGELIIPE